MRKITLIILVVMAIITCISYPPVNGKAKVKNFEEEIKTTEIYQKSHRLDVQIDSLQMKLRKG